MGNKKLITIRMAAKRVALLAALVVITGVVPAQTVFASTNSEYYTEIDNQMFEPSDGSTGTCSNLPGASTPTSSPVSGFAPDPKAVKMFESDIKPALGRLVPLYQEAAKDENFSEWQIIPGIHYREHGMSTNNPGNGDGVFQTTFNKWNDPNDPTLYQPNKVLTDKEFVEQLRGAIRYYLAPYAKGMGIDVTKALNADQAAKIAFAYNSGPAYTDHPYTTSTYAWAGFNTTTYKLPMTGVTGHIFPYVDNRPGTATVWGLVRGGNFPSEGGCGSGTAVTNNVVWYSQYDPRWENKAMGCGTIGSCGCYLTDLAMIASTWKNKKITPPDEPWVGIFEFASLYGFKATTLIPGPNPNYAAMMRDKVIPALQAHQLVMAHGDKGVFWDVAEPHEHWIILSGLATVNNQQFILVDDPADLPQPPSFSKPAQTSWGIKSHTYTQWPVSEFVNHAWDMYGFSQH